jgi:hypothetical protein
LKRIFADARRDSGLHKWAVDHIAALANAEELEVLKKGKIEEAVLLEVMKRMSTLRDSHMSPQKRAPSFADRCKYHEHADGDERCGE